jgi:mono/diheme cytochrome c family protein
VILRPRRHAAASAATSLHVSAFLLTVLCTAAPPALVHAAADTAVERGRRVFALAAGCGCHTPAGGPVGAGGAEIETPFGTFYGTNITPDQRTGIGAWSDADIDAAIRGGHVRGKGAEAPVMPYYLYAGMSDADTRDLIAYLRTLPPVRRSNRPHEGELPLARWAYQAWKLLFFTSPQERTDAPAGGVERGRYLADHVSLCIDCHTPRNALGALDLSMYLAGTAEGPGDEKVSNITPHETGIGDWDAVDIVNLLRERMLPNFDNVQGAMADVVDGVGGGPGYKDAPEEDLRAIADYLLTVAPIDNDPDDQ